MLPSSGIVTADELIQDALILEGALPMLALACMETFIMPLDGLCPFCSLLNEHLGACPYRLLRTAQGHAAEFEPMAGEENDGWTGGE